MGSSRLRGGVLGAVAATACLGFLGPLLFGTDPASGARVLAPGDYDAQGRLGTPTRPAAPARNLVVILLDTVRRDAVAYPGQPGGDMPWLSALAGRCAAFSNAASPSSWTVPAVASLLTGRLPHEHGCDHPAAPPYLPPAVTTYAEALRAGYGYETRFYGGSTWFNQIGESVLQGFEAGSVYEGFGLAGTREVLTDWARSRDRSRPYFLVLHGFDAHDPYGAQNHPFPDTVAQWKRLGADERLASFDTETPREPWDLTRVYFLDRLGREALVHRRGPAVLRSVVEFTWSGLDLERDRALVDELRGAYRSGLRWVDSLVESSVGALGDLGLLEDAMLVVTSDHGESFGEHGMLGHGRTLTEELVRVPLLVTGPGELARPALVTGSVGLIDVVPTFFDWAGLRPLPGERGRSLMPFLRGAGEGLPVVCEARVEPESSAPGVHQRLTAVRDGRWKYVVEVDLVEELLEERVYDLRADPEERQDLRAAGRAHTVVWDEPFCEAVHAARARARSELEGLRASRRATVALTVGTAEDPLEPACESPPR